MELTPEELELVPEKTGVYLFHDEHGKIIYIGKSKNLRKRLQTHFQPTTRSAKSKAIQTLVKKIRIIETTTEAEALLLEYNLIQKHKPRLNVQYKDQKSYPYVKITISEKYPRVLIVREEKEEGSLYLGPFPNVKKLRQSLKFILRLFPIADCNKEIHLGDYKKWAKTCIRRQIKTCYAPCQYDVPVGEYNKAVTQVIQFFSGKIDVLIRDLEKEMWDLSEKLEFEKAAKKRDIINALRSVAQKQRVFVSSNISAAIIAEAVRENVSAIVGFIVENGRVIDSFELHFSKDKDNKERFNPLAFLVEKLADPPGNLVLIGKGFSLRTELEKELLDRGVNVREPLESAEKELLEFCLQSAKLSLSKFFSALKHKEKRKSKEEDPRLLDLRKLLGNDKINVIHCFDVSTLFGQDNVASCVVFENGEPRKEKYRRFKSRLQGKQDDYYVMREVVKRYYEKNPLPDLLVIDGGLGQVRAARDALNFLEATRKSKRRKRYVLIGLAKKEETIVFPDGTEIKEDKNRPAILLLREVRDEAHRFAVSYNRLLRGRDMLHSIIDDIQGMGPKRKKKLLECFPDVSSLKNADPVIVSKKTGIPLKIVEELISKIRSTELLS